MAKPLLSVQDLSVGYETKKGLLKAVDGVSFSLEQGGSLGFVGESGCGKTTIGMTLMGLLPENATVLQGSMRFSDTQLTQISEKQWRSVRGKDIAMIFQAAMNALNPVYPIKEQIVEAISTHQPELSEQALDKRLKELFNLVEIPESRMKDYPHEYSGGMKQRAIIAMALACRPSLIIADEPTTALDVIVQDQILKEIKNIQQATNTSLIFISHDIAVVASVCETICVMYGGQIVETGTKEEVFKSPRHPYTKTLLASYISLDRQDAIVIPEMRETPDLVNCKAGCRFFNNCRENRCGGNEPAWVELSNTHKALCCDHTVLKEDS